MSGATGRAAGVLAAVVALFGVAAPPAAAGPLSDRVDLFNGTDANAPNFGTGGGGGNTYPGASAPYGMLNWSPDTYPSTTNFVGGYTYSDSLIKGFSLTHYAGGGCAGFGDLPFIPTVAPVDASPAKPSSHDLRDEYRAAFDHKHESARPGRYKVTLDPNTDRAIDVDLAAATRGGAGRFTFPATPSASVLINPGGSAKANSQAEVAIDPARRLVTGAATTGRFCEHRNSYRIYFAAEFSRPFDAHGTWTRNGGLERGGTRAEDTGPVPLNYTHIPGGPDSLPYNPSGTAQAGAFLTWDTTRERAVEVRVGISFASREGALANLREEVGGRTLENVAAATDAAWEEKLARVQARGAARDLDNLYTKLYHVFLSPRTLSDVDGRYPGFDGQVHQVEREHVHYGDQTLWDSARSHTQLQALLDPPVASDIARSIIDAGHRSGGFLPKFSIVNGHTNVQNGDPSDRALAGIHAFGARDWDAAGALPLMVKGATVPGQSENADYVQRPGLEDYQSLGYLPAEGEVVQLPGAGGGYAVGVDPHFVWGSAATTLEYSIDDFAISCLAQAVGDRPTAQQFHERGGRWRNLINPANGYLQPRSRSGAFPPFDPKSTQGYQEGNGAQYTWGVAHDVGGLVDALGGREAVERRLDEHFAELNAGPESEHAFLSNEPFLHSPWLYDWTGSPWKTQALVQRTLRELYPDTSPGAYPGNEDTGSLSTWFTFAAIGMHPAMPGTGVLALNSPIFREVVLRVPGRRPARIHAAGSGPYVSRLFVNGREHKRPWITAADLTSGATLDYRLSKQPNRAWGASAGAAPPSRRCVTARQTRPLRLAVKQSPMRGGKMRISLSGRDLRQVRRGRFTIGGRSVSATRRGRFAVVVRAPRKRADVITHVRTKKGGLAVVDRTVRRPAR